MKVHFWGVRGSHPTPGVATNRYGGNTSCVEVKVDGGPTIIIDAGTGIRKLGKEMMQGEFGVGQGTAYLLISHTHSDHIQGLPFFAPLYQKGNRLHVFSRQRDTHLRTVFASQTDAPYFSVPFDCLQAEVVLHEITEGERFAIGPVQVTCSRLNHPRVALAYRLECAGATLAYVTDTAPFRDILLEDKFISQPPHPGDPMAPEEAAKLAAMHEGIVQLCQGADLVIYDCQFTPAEYAQRLHWGHSCPDDAVEIVRRAGARSLALFHHAPDHSDDELDAIVASCQARYPDVSIFGAAESMVITLGEAQKLAEEGKVPKTGEGAACK